MDHSIFCPVADTGNSPLVVDYRMVSATTQAATFVGLPEREDSESRLCLSLTLLIFSAFALPKLYKYQGQYQEHGLSTLHTLILFPCLYITPKNLISTILILPAMDGPRLT